MFDAPWVSGRPGTRRGCRTLACAAHVPDSSQCVSPPGRAYTNALSELPSLLAPYCYHRMLSFCDSQPRPGRIGFDHVARVTKNLNRCRKVIFNYPAIKPIASIAQLRAMLATVIMDMVKL